MMPCNKLLVLVIAESKAIEIYSPIYMANNMQGMN